MSVWLGRQICPGPFRETEPRGAGAPETFVRRKAKRRLRPHAGCRECALRRDIQGSTRSAADAPDHWQWQYLLQLGSSRDEGRSGVLEEFYFGSGGVMVIKRAEGSLAAPT
ncbi:hypothetical protein NDU88_004159 [Pleurodeles waltl]|uniref:Uncharacterized protein n=1 Tax=Pleurodeles waltl TaxID=8319 RepID=A0AAV7RFB7_PLEWA|nr:hypothetical protein NDU88_004159 [Pleurodeles waltl]